jgi:prepilin-type N-terminal cleavage/methylation domain-containing protein
MCFLNRWQTNAQTRRSDRPGGFTIVELLLALAILVTLAAMVIPSFTGLLADRRVLRAGDQMRVEFMQARLSAMRSGRTYMVQLSTETHQLRIRPWVDANDMTEALDQTGGSAALLTGGNAMVASMQEVDVASEAREVDLPEGVAVTSLNVQSSQRSFMIESQVQAEAAIGWGQPILFYPDGTTSTAAVTVTSEGVGQVIVLLRGLTGEATVTDVLPIPETAGAMG